ncbi:MAG: DUF951 domain-containing protein [Chloroflexi bacterium]|nr:DUF951 domain-containing protein [Chloroflexota bacterium]
MPTDIRVDDIVQMRKTHACGGDRWRVYRVGADIGLRCLTCDRRILLPRARFERGVRRVVTDVEES